MIIVPDSLDICPDTLGYARILRIFTQIVWKGTFFWHIRCDRSDRSVRPVWPVQPGNFFLPLHGVKQSKPLTFHHFATDFFLLSPVRRPSSTLLSIFTPLEIWSSSPCFGCFITCIRARRGKSISGEAGFEVPHEFISLPRYHMFPSPDLLAQCIFIQSLWSSRFC